MSVQLLEADELRDQRVALPGCGLRPDGQHRPGAAFLLGEGNLDLIYSPSVREEIGRLARVQGAPQTPESMDIGQLSQAEVIFAGWGVPHFDEALLSRLPRLKAVFYGAGSIRSVVSEAFWERGILISSAWAANAVPVAEFSLGLILLSMKHFWKFSARARAGGGWGDQHRVMPGCFGTTVGLVSFGMIARKLNELLTPLDMRRAVHCPLMSREEADVLGLELHSLEDLFRLSDVVSIHTPSLPETRGLITGELVASMKHGATLINTARGAIIREPEMCEVLSQRPDLTAVLDVTDPEPPGRDSPLLKLPNVVLTPHIAGSHHFECRRMGAYMLAEFRRYLNGEPLQWQVTRESARTMA